MTFDKLLIENPRYSPVQTLHVSIKEHLSEKFKFHLFIPHLKRIFIVNYNFRVIGFVNNEHVNSRIANQDSIKNYSSKFSFSNWFFWNSIVRSVNMWKISFDRIPVKKNIQFAILRKLDWEPANDSASMKCLTLR